MTADVYATVAEAIRAEFGFPCDRCEDGRSCRACQDDAERIARAAVDALVGMGDVTDEELVAVADEYDNCFDLSMVRLFLARARATDQARIAEEHDFQRTVPTDGLWCQRCGLSANRWTSQPCDPEGALARVEAKMLDAVLVWKARAEAAEATLDRVRAIHSGVWADFPDGRRYEYCVLCTDRDGFTTYPCVHADDLRAALADPKGDA